MYGWRTKLWKFKNAMESETQKEVMKEWVVKHEGRYQIRSLFVNNAWAVEYRPLLFQ